MPGSFQNQPKTIMPDPQADAGSDDLLVRARENIDRLIGGLEKGLEEDCDAQGKNSMTAAADAARKVRALLTDGPDCLAGGDGRENG